MQEENAVAGLTIRHREFSSVHVEGFVSSIALNSLSRGSDKSEQELFRMVQGADGEHALEVCFTNIRDWIPENGEQFVSSQHERRRQCFEQWLTHPSVSSSVGSEVGGNGSAYDQRLEGAARGVQMHLYAGAQLVLAEGVAN